MSYDAEVFNSNAFIKWHDDTTITPGMFVYWCFYISVILIFPFLSLFVLCIGIFTYPTNFPVECILYFDTLFKYYNGFAGKGIALQTVKDFMIWLKEEKQEAK